MACFAVLPAWLKSQQYGEEMIGLVIGSAYIFRFAGGLFFHRWLKANHIIIALRLLALASAIIMAAMSLVAHNFWLLFIAIGLYASVNSAGMPIGIRWHPLGNAKSAWITAKYV